MTKDKIAARVLADDFHGEILDAFHRPIVALVFIHPCGDFADGGVQS